MPDAQTLALIEALERRVAHLEILEDPHRVCYLPSDIAVDAAQQFVKQLYTLWNNSAITLTLDEPGYIWWGYQFDTRCDVARTIGAYLQAFIDGVGEKLGLTQGYDVAHSRDTNALVGRSDAILAAGAHTIDVRIWTVNVNDTVQGDHLAGYAFWTRSVL